MHPIKAFFKRNSHAPIFKHLAGFGRSLNRFYENRNHHLETNGELALIQKLHAFNPKTIIDGGANKGKYATTLARELPQAKIYAFEPVPDTFNKLNQSVEHLPTVKTFNQGLYKESSRKTINLFSSSTHSSLFSLKGVNYNPNAQIEIDLITGDSFMQQENLSKIDLLKLDLEGAEYDALCGFKEALEKKAIRLIQFEYGYINISTKKLLIDFYELFEQYQYQVGKLFPKNVEFRPYHFLYEDFIGPNFIAVHKDDTELIQALESKSNKSG